MQDFKKLRIWSEGIDLVEIVYLVTRKFPNEEKFNLTSQLRRAVVSVPSNVAEGAGRRSSKEFRHFLSISLGSTYEIETQVIVAKRLGYLVESEVTEISERLTKIQKSTIALITKL